MFSGRGDTEAAHAAAQQEAADAEKGEK